MRHIVSSLCLLAALTAAVPAQNGCDLITPSQAEVGSTFPVVLVAEAPAYSLLLVSLDPGPTQTKFGTFELGFPFGLIMGIPIYGPLSFTCEVTIPCDASLVGVTIYGQVAMKFLGSGEICLSPGRSTTLVAGACLGTGTDPGDFTTFTQGGWGTKCAGNNPGCLRDTHFDSVFPNGLLLGDQDGIDGDGDHALLLSSSAAVKDFLPHGGTAGALTGDLTDPASAPSAGVLAGQAVAATLNVAFDDASVFGTVGTHLGDLVFVGGVHADLLGLSVRDVLALADIALAGGGTGALSFSDLSSALDVVNNNFDNGNQDLGHLALP